MVNNNSGHELVEFKFDDFVRKLEPSDIEPYVRRQYIRRLLNLIKGKKGKNLEALIKDSEEQLNYCLEYVQSFFRLIDKQGYCKVWHTKKDGQVTNEVIIGLEEPWKIETFELTRTFESKESNGKKLIYLPVSKDGVDFNLIIYRHHPVNYNDYPSIDAYPNTQIEVLYNFETSFSIGRREENHILNQLASNPLINKLASNPLINKLASNPLINKLASNPLLTKLASDPLLTKLANNPLSTNYKFFNLDSFYGEEGEHIYYRNSDTFCRDLCEAMPKTTGILESFREELTKYGNINSSNISSRFRMTGAICFTGTEEPVYCGRIGTDGTFPFFII